jgi:Arc/MetJ-type ribon-helix-helix transcriptional regulator
MVYKIYNAKGATHMSDTEKLTLNVTLVDLGKIDLLVEEGFYQHRSDFIRTAIRNELMQHKRKIDDITITKNWAMGVMSFNLADLQKIILADKQIDIIVIGLLRLSPDVTPEVAERAIASVRVRGKMNIPDDVREHLQALGRIS